MNSLAIMAFPGTTEQLVAQGLSFFGPYRPSQWSEPQLTYIVDSKGNFYFFDAVVRTEHFRSLRITEHPVQTGANLSDHSFQMPAHLSLEIGMSDAMDSYQPGQYQSGLASKSVNAYQAFLGLQLARLPVTITTRLDTYENMIIEQISAPDDVKTRYGLKAVITLKQIITAVVSNTKISANPQANQQTNVGPVQPTPPQGSALQGILSSVGIE